MIPPGPTQSQNSREVPSLFPDPPFWGSSLHPPSTMPVAVHPHAHLASKIFFLNALHY